MQLAAAMLPSFRTPLGPLASGRRLSDIPPSDLLAELGFEFPLAGGDRPTAVVTLGMVAPLLRRHLAADDPIHPYPALIDHPALAEQSLRGYLNGSIDAVLRVGEPSGEPRYLVVDYKTNWLGTFDGAPLTLADYTPQRMATAMMQAHYPLQALLYSVAVHRMLRWRQPGYDPRRHLGGVLYLFLRGMAGPTDPAGRRRSLRRLQLAAAGGTGGRAVRSAGRGAAVRAAVEQAAGSDVLLAYGTTGLLADFNAAGVLDAAGRADRPDHRPDRPRTARNGCVLALALAVRALRSGSVCIDLRDGVDARLRRGRGGHRPVQPALAGSRGVAGAGCAASGLVADGPDRPGGPPAPAGQRPALPRALLAPGGAGPPGSSSNASPPTRRTSIANGSGPPSTGSSRRRAAAHASRTGSGSPPPSARSARVTVIAGGPGTGKTTTVARLLALLTDQPGPPPRIALAAPTGKAAARLAEAVAGRGRELGPRTGERLGDVSASDPAPAARLAARVSRGRFRHDANNQLPHDVVVVDEMSMVSLTMMARLLEAVRPSARLILVGDPDQLSSVEAGAVLADIARAPGHAGRRRSASRSPQLGVRDQRRGSAGSPGGPARPHLAVRRGSAIDALAAGDPGGRRRRRPGRAAVRRAPNVRFTEVDLDAGDETFDAAAAERTSADRCGAPASPPWRPPVAGDDPGRADRARPAPAAVRAPPRAVRGGPVEPRGRALAGRGHRRATPRTGEWYLGRPAAGDGQRLRHGPLQRRHRGRRRRTRRCPGGVRPRGRPRAVPPGPAGLGPDRARDDRAPRPGQPVRVASPSSCRRRTRRC